MSTSQHHFSDEHINAFIDNQLDKRERAELLDALRHDTELSRRVCELEKVRSLVHLSYQSINIPASCQDNSRRTARPFRWSAAAALLLCVGALGGWSANQHYQQNSLLQLAQEVQLNQQVSDTQPWKLMLHVSTSDPYRLDNLLDETEALLQEYAQNGKQLKLEILANNQGLNLLSDNGQSYSLRLQKLQQTYHNMALLACNKTLQRYKLEHGEEVLLYPSTRIVPSALRQVIKRQKQGWTYVHI